jgi:hypothetical protein
VRFDPIRAVDVLERISQKGRRAGGKAAAPVIGKHPVGDFHDRV